MCSEHIDNCDMDCTGCGMHDSCGYHFTDCTLLEPGDMLVPRGVSGYREDIAIGEYQEEMTMATMIDRDMVVERITALMEMCQDMEAQYRRDQHYTGAYAAQSELHILSRARADILRLPIATTE